MYWDVVEVIPEPGYYLFVRFQDGLNGRVLRDVQFFRRAYIDYGAVAWPGERTSQELVS